MSDDQFWVNPEGLANSAGGFHEKAASVHSLLSRINNLSSPDRAEIVGLDSQGQGVWKQLQDSSGEMQQGLSRWRDSIHGAGDSLVVSARVFGATEDNNEQLASRLAAPKGVHSPVEPGDQLSDAPVQQSSLPLVAVRSEKPAHMVQGVRITESAPVNGEFRALRSEKPAPSGVGLSDEAPVPDSELQPAHMMMGVRREGTLLRPTEGEAVLYDQPGIIPGERFSESKRGVSLGQVTNETPAVPVGRVLGTEAAIPATPALRSTEVIPGERFQATPLLPVVHPQSTFESEQYSPVLPGIPAAHVLNQLAPVQPEVPVLPEAPLLPAAQVLPLAPVEGWVSEES